MSIIISINSNCKPLIYEGDSTIKCSHKIPEFISQKLGKELERCSEYGISTTRFLYTL